MSPLEVIIGLRRPATVRTPLLEILGITHKSQRQSDHFDTDLGFTRTPDVQVGREEMRDV